MSAAGREIITPGVTKDEQETALETSKRGKEIIGVACTAKECESPCGMEESGRLQLLQSCVAINPEKRAVFDRVMRLASRVLGAPKAFISLISPQGGMCHYERGDEVLSYTGAQQFGNTSTAALGDSSNHHQHGQEQKDLQKTELFWFAARAFALLLEAGPENADGILDVPDARGDCRFSHPLGGYHGETVTDGTSSKSVVGFYACASIVVKGHLLGILSISSPKPREEALSPEDINIFQDLAGLVADAIVAPSTVINSNNPLETLPPVTVFTPGEQPGKVAATPTLNKKGEEEQNDEQIKSLIADTSHALFTPLMGIELSLAVLQDDSTFAERPDFQEVFSTAAKCSNTLVEMSNCTINTLRSRFHNNSANSSELKASEGLTPTHGVDHHQLDVDILVNSLETIMKPLPKPVPMNIQVQRNVPDIVTLGDGGDAKDSLRIMVSALNLLSYSLRVHNKPTATRTAATLPGTTHYSASDAICLNIRLEKYAEGDEAGQLLSDKTHESSSTMAASCLVFECNVRHDSSFQDLAVQSVQLQMNAIIGGKYGFRGQEATNGVLGGSCVFWFSFPIQLTRNQTISKRKAERVVTLMPNPSGAPSTSPDNHSSSSSVPGSTGGIPANDNAGAGSRKSAPNQQRQRYEEELPSFFNVCDPSGISAASMQNDSVQLDDSMGSVTAVLTRSIAILEGVMKGQEELEERAPFHPMILATKRLR